ncbi:MBOAT family protein [Paenibacillus melissococcoides]|uniref:MBOAT family protein n=1 Tax=Paenibacillus melissococcoides TaxID=2912268 RepID=A0ABN8U4S0_9BACL|nr:MULTISPECIES: MBOAT family protein [Paenibacillus]MEB9892269.1 MBOAT family protein [Bacillus cereus]CAH8245922.1 MBOAT family protein [Paenibacillus melissococcoides]CAH8712474.1 MBOAT family protein [Paenibacillus melissococcoides]CAH8713220.1 MBOAT family protein [Paenibacillus melissococcoides]GIO77547.1 alginate regulatory protein [Paenibacillus dendritiformis]
MVFSSIVFLFTFLPAALLLYYASPRRGKNAALLLISLLFYAWGEPVYIVLLLFSAVTDYGNGLLIERFRGRAALQRLTLIFSLAVNVGVLCFFKYADFLIHSLNGTFGTSIAPLDLPLPIGISFYTFQTMSYTIDVYRGRCKAQRSFIDFAAFVSMFPQLVAGPIVRYDEVEKQLTDRSITLEQFGYGVRRFIIGLGKKVLLANNIGMLWDVSRSGIDDLTTAGAWIGIIAFAFQIYFDFSGYSDMAIGLGSMLGFRFPENFNYPYISASASEFWRRWHMTLGSWFRDYVYFPLGGSRTSKPRLMLNLFVVWFLTGLWHGASWNFVLWGLYFGLLIGLEKLFLGAWLERLWRPVRHAYLFVAALFGWVLFGLEDIASIGNYTGTMLGLGDTIFLNGTDLYNLRNYGLLLVILVISATPLAARATAVLQRRPALQAAVSAADYALLAGMLFASTAYLIDGTYNPFLYFRF